MNNWEEDGICDGCAQLLSECLCDVDLEEVMRCDSPFHPGCSLCAMYAEADRRIDAAIAAHRKARS